MIDDDERIQQALGASAAVPMDCILCGAITHSRGLFFPRKSEDYGGEKDGQRIVIYPLCEDENRSPEMLEVVEQLIYNSINQSKA